MQSNKYPVKITNKISALKKLESLTSSKSQIDKKVC